MLRLGIPPVGGTNRTVDNRIRKKVTALKQCIPQSEQHVVDSILNTTPNSYPDIHLTSDTSNALHARCGRRFELSMYCFDVVKCDCCGAVQPTHCDPDIKLRVTFPFERKAFTTSMKTAWECNCIDTCKGQQFYSTSSSLQIKWFKQHHGSLLPNEVLRLPLDSPNATICHSCATDLKPNELIIGRSFSTRNGFGPIMKYVPPPLSQYLYITQIHSCVFAYKC